MQDKTRGTWFCGLLGRKDRVTKKKTHQKGRRSGRETETDVVKVEALRRSMEELTFGEDEELTIRTKMEELTLMDRDNVKRKAKREDKSECVAFKMEMEPDFGRRLYRSRDSGGFAGRPTPPTKKSYPYCFCSLPPDDLFGFKRVPNPYTFNPDDAEDPYGFNKEIECDCRPKGEHPFGPEWVPKPFITEEDKYPAGNWGDEDEEESTAQRNIWENRKLMYESMSQEDQERLEPIAECLTLVTDICKLNRAPTIEEQAILRDALLELPAFLCEPGRGSEPDRAKNFLEVLYDHPNAAEWGSITEFDELSKLLALMSQFDGKAEQRPARGVGELYEVWEV